MKEDYYGGGRLVGQAWAFLDSVSHLRKNRTCTIDADIVGAGEVALLVMDMQDYFLDEASHAHIPSAAAIVPRIEELQRFFLENRLPVILTRHLNDPRDAGRMACWWRELITVDNPLSRITGCLDCEDALVLTKSQYDAFYNTSLEEELRRRGVTQVVITGVMAHLCCETTARSAFVRGFDVFFVIDAVATYNREFHRAALLNLAHGFAVPVLAQELLNSI
jgi:isochorismate hydrolase